jgi:lysophospholipase L1-like esterase
MKNKITLFCLLLLTTFFVQAQDPARFQKEVDRLFNTEYDFSPAKKLVVFTGSSSIGMWNDIQERFPEFNVINNGFGGSHFSDLIYFYNELITKQTPEILFIYEGDNDVGSGKKTSVIYRDFKTLSKKLQRDLTSTKVVFISPKPSIARWHLNKQYHKINKKMARYCRKTDGFEFADVWPVMLENNGEIKKDLFIRDGLHMNKKGYDLWQEVIGEFLK